jgi:K+-transporting ATPase KdpF subunit
MLMGMFNPRLAHVEVRSQRGREHRHARCRLRDRHLRLLRCVHSLRSRVRPFVIGDRLMQLDYVLGATVSVLLSVYLVYALLVPEKF